MSDNESNPTVAEEPARECAKPIMESVGGDVFSSAHSATSVTRRRDHSSASFKYTLKSAKPIRKSPITLICSSALSEDDLSPKTRVAAGGEAALLKSCCDRPEESASKADPVGWSNTKTGASNSKSTSVFCALGGAIDPAGSCAAASNAKESS